MLARRPGVGPLVGEGLGRLEGAEPAVDHQVLAVQHGQIEPAGSGHTPPEFVGQFVGDVA